MDEHLRYRLQIKVPCTEPDKSFQWRDVVLSNDLESLKRTVRGRHDLRVIDTLEGIEKEVTPDG